MLSLVRLPFLPVYFSVCSANQVCVIIEGRIRGISITPLDADETNDYWLVSSSFTQVKPHPSLTSPQIVLIFPLPL